MSKIKLKYLVTIIFCLSSVFTLQSVSAEEGIAAYYSDVFQGRKTASGQRYNRNKLTAAHNTLAFGTKVKVTDLTNNKSVTVTITDRGPSSKSRIIDLSYAAAKKINLIKRGIGSVRLDVIN